VIVVAGEALVDVIVHPDGGSVAVPGGGPYNAARAIGRLGVPVSFAGCLSTDEHGRAMATALVDDGVSLDLVQRSDLPTTRAQAELDARGEAQYRFDVVGTSAPSLDAATAKGTWPQGLDALHVGTLGLVFEPMATTIEELVAGLSRDAMLMVDPNCRPSAVSDEAGYRARMARLLDRADIVKTSVADLAYLGYAPASRLLVITDGARPVRVRHDGRSSTIDAPPTEVVDTVGAGDTFGGALLASLVHDGVGRSTLGEEVSVLRAVRFAARASAAVCGRAGADPPTLGELGGW
jgi:fructokinase